MGEKEFLTVKEVAELLRVKPLTIYRMVKDSRLKGYSIGRNLRFKRQDIDAFLERCKVGHKS